MLKSVPMCVLLGTLAAMFQLDRASAYYFNHHQLYQPNPALMYQPLQQQAESSNLYANYDNIANNAQQRQQVVDNDLQMRQNAIWQSIQQTQPAQNNFYNSDDESTNNNGGQSQNQQAAAYLPAMSRQGLFFGAPGMQQDQMQPQESQSVCATGFVEHCLVQANSDGEQRLLASMVANAASGNNNQSSTQERETLTREFDGMCHVVIRFIDCLNAHYAKCGGSKQQPMADGKQFNKDMFAESWSTLCAPNGEVRQKYLKHSSCIKQALTENNGQEQCQARFQTYFMSGHMSLDSIESAVHYGCCAFNEWQYCIDSLIVKQCGHDAMKSVQDLIELASGGLVSSLCDRKTFGRKSKVCSGKSKAYGIGSAKMASLDPKINATLHKYIGISGDFIDRLPDDEE